MILFFFFSGLLLLFTLSMFFFIGFLHFENSLRPEIKIDGKYWTTELRFFFFAFAMITQKRK